MDAVAAQEGLHIAQLANNRGDSRGLARLNLMVSSPDCGPMHRFLASRCVFRFMKASIEGASGPDSSSLSRLGLSIGQFLVEIVMDKGAGEQVMYQVRGSIARLFGIAGRDRDSRREDPRGARQEDVRTRKVGSARWTLRRAGGGVLFHSWVLPKFILPLHERLSRHDFWSGFLELKALQWSNPAELQARSLANLQGLLRHAYEEVPYYRDLFTKAGLVPTDIRTMEDLSLLPITTKEDMRRNFPSRIMVQDLKRGRAEKKVTSGSTGMPLEFYADKGRMDIVRSSYLFFWDWAGLHPWTPGVRIAIPPHFYSERSIRASIQNAIRRMILGERVALLAGESLDVEELEKEIRRVAGHGTYYIWAFPSYAARLAAQILERGIPFQRPPCVVISYAESLSPADERLIREAFDCTIANHYGSLEIPFVAQTCPENQGMLHINSERAVVRVVAEDGIPLKPGRKGRVIITDLSNYVMPFINYDTGDMAVAGEACPCGRGLPTIERLEGRKVEVLRVPGGRAVSSGTLGHFLCSVCKAAPYLLEYQFVQTNPSQVTLKLVPTSLLPATFCEFLRVQLEEFLDGRMAVSIETVDAIEREVSGKRFIIKSSLIHSTDRTRE